MSDIDPTQILGEWEGYVVKAVRRLPKSRDAKFPRIRIELTPREGQLGRCSGCGRRVASVHETTDRVVRDLPILDAQTYLVVPRRRLACPRCGPKLERLSWLAPWGRVTTRLAESVARLCQVMSVKHVAQYYGLGWDRVKGRIGSKRIEQIVSSQHRSAYQRAAEVLGALAECFLLRGDVEKARDTMHEYRNQKFSRHKAFRQKLDQVIGSSKILSRGLRTVVG